MRLGLSTPVLYIFHTVSPVCWPLKVAFLPRNYISDRMESICRITTQASTKSLRGIGGEKMERETAR